MKKPDDSADFVRRLQAATNSSFEELDRLYRQRLCALVEKELNRRYGGREDPEDAVQSALRSFFRGASSHRFQIDHSGALWKLLVTIVRHKILKHVEYHQALKRRPHGEVLAEDIDLVSREPNPEEAAELTDILERLVDQIEPEEVDILRLRMQGLTKAEIGQELDLKEGTVKYRLDKITDLLARILAEVAEK